MYFTIFMKINIEFYTTGSMYWDRSILHIERFHFKNSQICLSFVFIIDWLAVTSASTVTEVLSFWK
jgi:hypothetical protein